MNNRLGLRRVVGVSAFAFAVAIPASVKVSGQSGIALVANSACAQTGFGDDDGCTPQANKYCGGVLGKFKSYEDE